MRTFVSIDTESGIVRRYSQTAFPTHEAGLTHDPEDADATRSTVERFRQNPHDSFKVASRPGLRTYDDALAEQIMARERSSEKQLLLGPPSHRDEA